MKNTGWFSRRSNQQPSTAMIQRIAGSIGVAALLMTAGIAAAQNPTPDVPLPTQQTNMSTPNGYKIHQSVDLGGHITGLTGSLPMYDTLVNIQSGPRVQGETFEMHALPGTKHTLVDSLMATGNGFGGDPNNFAKLDFSKGKIYDFTGMFRRDRQYFDYDLLGNPNVPTGRSIPIGPSTAPTGSYAWPQIEQSPEMFNTVRRMTDTNLTLFPLSKVTFRAGYSQNIFQGPSLTPSGYQVAGAYSLLLQEFQRNSTDDFTGAIDWKPVEGTKLTFEEQVDHYKGDSYFTLAPSRFMFQESDGTPVTPLISFDSQTAYAANACNTSSMMQANTILYAPQTPGGLPVIDPACAVATGYQRTQPTRILYPTEIFRFQSTSIKNISMNGDFSYTNANMNLANYYDSFQGLTHAANAASAANRSITYAGNANAKREVMVADYGIVWQATKTFSLSDQFDYSNVHQPGTSVITSGTTLATPGAPNQTINYPTLTTTSAANGAATFEGSAEINTPLPDYFGQRFLTNYLTGTWDAFSNATVSLTYRYGTHMIAEGNQSTGGGGNPGDIPIPVGATSGGTVIIHETGGIFNAALRPTKNWEVNGTAEVLYHDNAFTPLGPRQTKHYRVHTMYRPRPWATISGSFNDREQHNNTNNAQADVAAAAAAATPTQPDALPFEGPIDHVDHSRVASLGADLTPNEHYGLSFNYSYSDVYTATNICYTSGAAGSSYPGVATLTTSGAPNVCSGIFARGSTTTLVDWHARDFMDAPTQYGSVALNVSPIAKLHSSIGYRISSVNGSQFFNDARSVNGSLVSAYQSPFVSAAWTVHTGWIWSAQYNYYGYGEGGPSGAQYCSTTTSLTATVVPCDSPTLTGPTGLTETSAGLTAPRNFHANNVTLGLHYEF